MPSTIVMTKNNISNLNRGNNQLVYSFPNSVTFPNHEIAITNIAMAYSWFNIDSTSLNNSTFYYLWAADGTVSPPNPRQWNIVIPDGLYEISTINYYLQFKMIQNGHYLIDAATGDNVYFMEMVINPANYTVQMNTYPIPNITALNPSGFVSINGVVSTTYKYPAAWTYVTATGVGFIPTICMSNPNLGGLGTNGAVGVPTDPHVFNNFYKVVGFTSDFTTNANTYALAVTVTNKSANSSSAPQVQANSTIFFAISNIDNKYSNPSTIVYQLSPTVNFGDLITVTPAQFSYNKLIPGTYNNIRLSILGTNLAPITIQDPELTITMVIRDRKDITLSDALNTAQGGK